MTQAAATLPIGAFSNLIWGSSYLDGAFGIYKRGYHFWRWYAGASIVLEGDIKKNVALIAFSGSVDFATKCLGASEYYRTFARIVAIAYYAVQTLNHLCQTWEDIGKMKAAFYEKESACVIDFIDPPRWTNYVMDPATGRWALTSLSLIALKMQRIAATTFIVAKDIFLIPYFMWRVQDAYFMDNFFEEKACKGMALLHAKLLLEDIGRYQKLAEANMINITSLVNQILEISSAKIKLDEATQAAEKMNRYLLQSPKKSKDIPESPTSILLKITNIAVAELMSPLGNAISLTRSFLMEDERTPEISNQDVRPEPRIVNNPRKVLLNMENPSLEELSENAYLPGFFKKLEKNYLYFARLDPIKNILLRDLPHERKSPSDMVLTF